MSDKAKLELQCEALKQRFNDINVDFYYDVSLIPPGLMPELDSPECKVLYGTLAATIKVECSNFQSEPIIIKDLNKYKSDEIYNFISNELKGDPNEQV